MKPLWKVIGFEQQTFCPRHRTAQRTTAQENKVDKETQKQTDKQGDTQHRTAQRTAARRSVIHSSPVSLSSFLLFSSLLSYPPILCFMRKLVVTVSKKKIEEQETQPDNILASWYTRHDKKSHNDKCINKPRWEEKILLSDARLRARRASLWRDHHADGNYRGAGAKRLRSAITKVVRTIW